MSRIPGSGGSNLNGYGGMPNMDTSALFGDDPSDIYGSGARGENFANLLQDAAGGGSQGMQGLQQFLNEGQMGNQNQGGYMMGGQQGINPASFQGQGLGGGSGGGGMDPQMMSSLSGMSEEDRNAILALMQQDQAEASQGVSNAAMGNMLGGIGAQAAGLGGLDIGMMGGLGGQPGGIMSVLGGQAGGMLGAMGRMQGLQQMQAMMAGGAGLGIPGGRGMGIPGYGGTSTGGGMGGGLQGLGGGMQGLGGSMQGLGGGMQGLGGGMQGPGGGMQGLGGGMQGLGGGMQGLGGGMQGLGGGMGGGGLGAGIPGMGGGMGGEEEALFDTPIGRRMGMGRRPGTTGGQTMRDLHGMTGQAGGMFGVDVSDAFQAQIQETSAQATSCNSRLAQGMNTIIILDTSDSMKGDGIKESKDAIEKFIMGLEDIAMEYGLEENLALITCGAQTTVIQHLTNDYHLIRQHLSRIQTSGNTPLQLSIALVFGALARANELAIGGHSIRSRVILISDGYMTTSDHSGPDLANQAPKPQECDNVVRMIQSLRGKKCVRFVYVPNGNNINNNFAPQVERLDGCQVTLAGDIKSLCQFHIYHRLVAEVKQQSEGAKVNKEMVKSVAVSNYPNLTERDYGAIMELLEENNEPTGLPALDPGLQSLADLGMPSDRGSGGNPPGSTSGTNPFPLRSQLPSGRSNTDLPQRMENLNLGGASGMSNQTGAGADNLPFTSATTEHLGVPLYSSPEALAEAVRAAKEKNESSPNKPFVQKLCTDPNEELTDGPFTKEQLEEINRQVRERKAEIQRMRERGEWPPKDTDSLPFQLPGLMARPDGPESQQEESEEVTQEKINELLEKYGGGPPKTDNLPIPLDPGVRVTTGPDWMWRMNGVELEEQGTVVPPKEDDPNRNPNGEWDGWIRVRWDNGVEEDYRYGLDYEFDIQPLVKGMDGVHWPPGKARIIKDEESFMSDGDDFLEEMSKMINKPDPDPEPEFDRTGPYPYDPVAEQEAGGFPHVTIPDEFKTPEQRALEESLKEQLEKARKAGDPSGGLSALFQQPQSFTAKPQTNAKPATNQPQQQSFSATNFPSNTGGPQVNGAMFNQPQTTTRSQPSSSVSFQQPTPSTIPSTPSSNTGTTGTSIPTASGGQEVCFVWQYYSDNGDWKSYPPEIQTKAEAEYLKRKGKGSVVIDMGNGSERIIFKSWEQRNIEKQIVRPVRRIEADAEKLRELQEMWSSN